MERARFREFILIFQVVVRTALPELLFLTTLSMVAAHEAVWQPSRNTSKLDENARSHRGESSTTANLIIAGTVSNDISDGQRQTPC